MLSPAMRVPQIESEFNRWWKRLQAVKQPTHGVLQTEAILIFQRFAPKLSPADWALHLSISDPMETEWEGYTHIVEGTITIVLINPISWHIFVHEMAHGIVAARRPETFRKTLHGAMYRYWHKKILDHLIDRGVLR